MWYEIMDAYQLGCGKQREATTHIHPQENCNVVPEFPEEDLPLGRTAALVPEFAVKDLPFGITQLMMMKN